LTPVEMGYVFSAFGLAYALFELPAGMYGDRKGPRKALTRIVVWWSLFTIATGGAFSFTSMWITRFLFGAGEAGCYPTLARVFRTWLPVTERPVAEGLKAASARLGAATAPYLVVTLLAYTSWRGVFLAFGSLGLLWAAGFFLWFRDRPSEHASVNDAERSIIPVADHGAHRPAPWSTYLTSRSLWLLSFQWFFHFYAFYFYITWLPTYLQEVRGANIQQSALLAGMPVLMAALGSLAGGWILTRMIRRMNDIGRARKRLAYVSYIGAAIFMVLAIRPDSVELAVILMSLSSFAAELSAPITWTTAMDLGGRNVGAISGAMNSLGQFGGAVAPTVVGFLVESGPGGWDMALYSAAAVYGAAFLCWLYLDPVTPL